MQTSTRKFGDPLAFEVQPMSREQATASWIKLPPTMRVVGLKRKSKNGTTFQIFDSRQLGKRQPPVTAWCQVTKTSKDGKVTAYIPITNSYFIIDTKDTVRWPHAVPTT